jgi:hypothetical protein
MYRIPVINQSTLFEDIDRKALVYGKIEVLDPVSNNPLTIWSYSDDEYTVMTNPVRLDIEGRVPQTVFCDRIVYCRVYAFKGYDEHNQPIWEFIRDFYAGENENSESREYVVGLEALKDLDPTINSSVNVLGYFSAYDCPMRQYVWDPTCTQDADNGYIVASDVSATGRWILVFSGEYLPSSYYGVYPGHVANINALLSYVEYVGTASTKTAPGVWFVPGNYSVETNLQTTKRVLLDAGTSFSCQYFYCGNLKVIGEPQTAICDFDFYDNEQEAHSSWFKTVFGFLTSNAKKYILDAKDNFVNKTLQASVTLQDKIIEGQTRLPVTYTGSGKITLRNCVINAERIFNSTDILSFAYTEIHDHWWNNPADIDFYGKVAARTISLNSLVIDNFTNMTAYVNAVGADGQQVLDMAGRSIYNLELPLSVTELRNVHVTNNANIPANGRDITLRNCEFANTSVTSRYLTVYDSRIHFYMEPSVSAMWGYNSEIRSGSDFVNKAAQYVFEDCKVGINFKRVTDNDARDAFLEFTRCNFDSCVIESKTLRMMNCDCEGCTIKIYPYKDNDVYKMYCYLEGNRFISGQPVEFTKVDLIDGAYQDNVYDIQVSWTIINNFFAGNTEGLRCRYWQHRTGSNYGKTFIATNKSVFNVVYEGNTGNCPANDMRGVSITNNQGYVKETVSFGTGTVDIYKYATSNKRVMPEGDDGYWFMQSVKGPNILMKYYSWINKPYNSLTYDMFIHTSWYLYPSAHDEHVYDGDFFNMAILSYNDYIRIVQHGDGDRNQGVVAMVI